MKIPSSLARKEEGKYNAPSRRECIFIFRGLGNSALYAYLCHTVGYYDKVSLSLYVVPFYYQYKEKSSQAPQEYLPYLMPMKT
jgi:nicotinamide riboside transporter PnuC